jgi:hypothetical protein
MRVANFVFAALFSFSVVVQYNDPDPMVWMAIYGAALGACLAWERRRLPRGVAWAIVAVASAWAIVSLLGTHLQVPFFQALSDWKMHAGGSEELRETLGLVLVAGWVSALALKPR